MLAKQRRSNAEQASELQLRSSASKAKAKETKNGQSAARVPLRRSAKDDTVESLIDSKEEEEEEGVSHKETKKGRKRTIKLITQVEETQHQSHGLLNSQVVDLTSKQASTFKGSELDEMKRENAYLRQQLQQFQSQPCAHHSENKATSDSQTSIQQCPSHDYQSLRARAQQPQEVSTPHMQGQHYTQHQYEHLPQPHPIISPQQFSQSGHLQQVPYQPIPYPANFHAPTMDMQHRTNDQMQPAFGANSLVHPIANVVGQSNLGLHALLSTNATIARGHSTYEGRVAFQEFSSTLLSGLNYYFQRGSNQ